MIKIKDESVILSLDSGQTFDLPFLWLRDNCQCDECRITETEEKQFLLHKVPVDFTPDNVQIIDERIHISTEPVDLSGFDVLDDNATKVSSEDILLNDVEELPPI